MLLEYNSCQLVAKLQDNANKDPEIPVFRYTLYSTKLKIKTYHQHNLFVSTLYMQYLQKDHQNIEKLAVARSILNGNIFKNNVLAPIFNFSVQTGSIF